MPSLYCKAWVMAVGKFQQSGDNTGIRYRSAISFPLWGISGEKQKKGWLQYSVGDAASYLAGTESLLEVFLPIAVLVHITDGGYIIFRLEFLSLLFSLLLNQDCVVEKRERISSGCSCNRKWWM